ncbi:MAG TPA: hypothetical protein DG048_05210 [Pseudoalteromonas sp.]|nr:hypothetical protein [Pseudoalteromonas sp.]
MLIYFSVDNFRSINEPIELNLKAAPRLRRLKSHVRTPIDKDEKLKVLKSGVIYGANASGKSNIIKAIDYAKRLITGETELSFCPRLRNSYFALNGDVNNERSFNFEFTFNKRAYAYFFKTKDEKVLEEELVLLDKNTETVIFYRNEFLGNDRFNSDFLRSNFTDKANSNTDALSELSFLYKYTPKNKLFLTEASEKFLESFNKNDLIKDNPLDIFFYQLINAYYFFRTSLITIFPETKYSGSLPEIRSGAGRYFDLITKLDTGITKLTEVEVPLSEFSKELLSEIEEQISDDDHPFTFKYENVEHLAEIDRSTDKLKVTKLATIHTNGIQFEVVDESDGTQRLLDLLPALHNDSMEKVDRWIEFTYIIDEFDRSLHPLISYGYLDTFLNQDNNDQIIATTHEAELLNNELLRRDEVWFTQKEKSGTTKLYSLNDYTTRHDKDIHKAYLKGIFGGIPNIAKRFK